MTVDAVWLVRHASTDWTGIRWCGRSDPHLSAAGRAEAEVLAGALADRIGPSAGLAIVSSPARRALETASALAERIGRPVRQDADFHEADFGAVDGLTFDELSDAYPAIAKQLLDGRADIDWPGGERAASLRQRVLGAWRRVLETDASEVVVVSHAGSVAALLAQLVPSNERLLGPGGAVRLVSPADGVEGWRVVDRIEPA